MLNTYKTQKPLTADIDSFKPFYMVIRLGSSNVQQIDAAPTVRYDNREEAMEEAERLAYKHPNHPRGFAVVKAITIIKAEISISGYNLE